MTASEAEKIRGLLHFAHEQPDGELKFKLVEHGLRMAEAAQNLDVAYLARLELINAASGVAKPDQAIVAFSWCLSQLRQDPAPFQRYLDLTMFYFKYVISCAACFPQISLDKIDEMLAEMAEFYEMFGHGPRSVHFMRWHVATKCYSLRAQDDYDAWLRMDRDAMADCEACERDHQCSRWILAGEHQRAIDTSPFLLHS